MQNTELDILIIGAGPAGLSAGCACLDLGLRCLVLDRAGLAQSFVEYPQALMFFSPPDEMEIGGVALPVAGGLKPTRETYLAYLRGVARTREIPLATWEGIAGFDRDDDGGFTVTTRLEPNGKTGRTVRTRGLIVATGLWHDPVRLGVPGEDLPHVMNEFHEPTPYFGQPVLVVGGGNSAVGGALSLMEARAKVTLTMRRPPKNYRSGLRPFVKRDLGFAVDEGKVVLHANTVVTEITPDAATLQPVRYTGNEDLTEGSAADYESCGEPFRVPARFVFTLTGHRPDTHFLHTVLGLDCRADGRPVCELQTWETSVPNIFVAGSLADGSIDVVLGLRQQAREAVENLAARLDARG